ncbi:hypothetical protein [Streptomyces sp. H51]|uniref:hypothetical protein n=1 Tax=Streptomyces sp. H51 TaxID=3111770 RepID=UPI002D785090|nr:hypothetical protein [Streptomyces sp. H51]
MAEEGDPQKAIPMNFPYGHTLYVAAGAEELFPWFAVMFGILAVTVLVMLMKTRHH